MSSKAGATRRERAWSTPADVVTAVQRRWSDGRLPTAYARGEECPTIEVPLHGPAASEVAGDLAAVRAWTERLVRGATRSGRPAYELVMRSVGGRAVGRNELPARAVVSSYSQAWTLLGVQQEVAALDRLLRLSQDAEPAWRAWLADHPLRALAVAEEWEQVLAAAGWLREHAGSGRYLREVSAPGVDTKFIERHRLLLSELVELVLDEGLVDPRRSRGREFALRYGLAQPRPLVRLRAPAGQLPGGFIEMAARFGELADWSPPWRHVVIVENEVSFLSLPLAEGTALLFGSGYDAARLGRLGWLSACGVDYWGDLDTHGFAILNRLRASVPHARSLLMDRATLLEHRDRWGSEPSPTRERLAHLTVAEADLYRDLVEDTFAAAVRLEQERVDWTWVLDRYASLSAPVPPT